MAWFDFFSLGVEGEKGRNFDFLNSIEVLIMDQTEIFLMQNWDHILTIFQVRREERMVFHVQL